MAKKKAVKPTMWQEIKVVWVNQWASAKESWKQCWYDVKDTIISAVYAVANFIWAVLETVVFLPIKTGLYETGAIIVKHIVEKIKRI